MATGPEKMTYEAVSQRLTAAATEIEGWTKEEFFARSKRRAR